MSERHVLVTGANSGIGLATVLELAKREFRVTGTVRSEAKASTVTKEAKAAGVEVETRILDVTDADGCEALIDSVGTLHGLVNNAGYGMTGAVEDVADDEVHQILDTMLVAPIRLARLAIPAMRAAGGGRIVNISSIYGRTTTPLTGWYQGTKHALEGVSDALRMEVAKDGIHVVLVEPGGFKTNIWEDLQRDLDKRAGSDYTQAYERLGSLQGPVVGADGRAVDLREGHRQGARDVVAALAIPRRRRRPPAVARRRRHADPDHGSRHAPRPRPLRPSPVTGSHQV